MNDYLLDAPRSGSRLFTSHTEYVGIDKIRLIYPVHQLYSDGSYDLFTKHKVKKTKGHGVLLDYIGEAAVDPRAPIYIELRNHGTEALVEFNPARQLDVAGDTLCHPDAVVASVIWVFQELSYVAMPRFAVDFETQDIVIDDYMQWEPGWMGDCRLTRLDVARDIYSPYSGFSIDSILHVKKSRYKNDYVYRNNGKNESITWGSKASARCTIYNKSLKHHNDPTGGWFRFEVQAHTETLKRFGLRTLDGMSESRAYNLLWSKWDQSNMGLPISVSDGPANLSDDLVKVLAPREVQSFLGVAYSLSRNLPVYVSDRTVNKYRKIGRELGFVLGDNPDNLGQKKVFIDLAAGELTEYKDFPELTQTSQDFGGIIEQTEPQTEKV